MKTYASIAEIKAANAAAGHHFFQPEARRFFASKIGRTVYCGRYFVTSEQFVGSTYTAPRRYSARYCDDNGHIQEASEFQAFESNAAAVRFIRSLPECQK